MSDVTWEAPAPGRWMLETAHYATPVTPYLAGIYRDAFHDGMGELFERYGVPLERIELRFVRGYNYGRPVPLGTGGKVRPAPPPPVLKVLSRLHPGMRRRTRAARDAFTHRVWLSDVRRWRTELRPRQEAANLALQDEVLEEMDDDALADHVERATANLRSAATVHFSIKADIPAVGDFAAHAIDWGIDPAEALDLLRGSSPATHEIVDVLRPATDAARRAGVKPSSTEEMRRLGPEAARAVESFERLFAWRVVTNNDTDGRTLAEMPHLAEETVLAVVRSTEDDPAPPDPSAVRERVPAEERDRFDEVLEQARTAQVLRDDNCGIQWTWPIGLVRRALLEAGRRLAGGGSLQDADHVFECRPEEAAALLRGERGPGAEELASRAAERAAASLLRPPAFLGEEPPPPSFDVFPAPLARMAKGVMAFVELMLQNATERPELEGTGVGAEPYRGRACVVRSAEDAFERLEQGDVIVAPFTTPAYNAILPLVGAIAVEEGGQLSHAAILARELGVPAVVGARGLLDAVADGAEIEVDPASGRVRVLEAEVGRPAT